MFTPTECKNYLRFTALPVIVHVRKFYNVSRNSYSMYKVSSFYVKNEYNQKQYYIMIMQM